MLSLLSFCSYVPFCCRFAERFAERVAERSVPEPQPEIELQSISPRPAR